MTPSQFAHAVYAATNARELMPKWANYKSNPTRGALQRRRWLALRQEGIGSSDIATILGCEGAHSSRFALWWQKQPGASLVDLEPTEAMEWGARLEQAIADKFAELHPSLVVARPPAHMYAHPEIDWARATPDRVAVDRVEPGIIFPVEVKTDANPHRWEAGPPDMFRVQLAWQCIVLGVRRGFLAALITPSKHYIEFDITFERSELDDILLDAGEFIASLSGFPPEIDGHRETRAELMRQSSSVDKSLSVALAMPLVDEYETACILRDHAAERHAAASNKVRAAMGSAGRATDPQGRMVAHHLVYKVAESVHPAHEVDTIRRAK
jgi:putative phage-type endonuclease